MSAPTFQHAFESILAWTDCDDLPDDAAQRLEYYARRMLSIRNVVHTVMLTRHAGADGVLPAPVDRAAVSNTTASARPVTPAALGAHFDRFDICEAYLALEQDYNISGLLQERASNQRRQESTGVQLARVHFSPSPLFRGFDSLSENGKLIYVGNAIAMGIACQADKDWLDAYEQDDDAPAPVTY